MRQHIGLAAPRLGPLAAVMRDVSLGGAFVETDPRRLPPHTPVTVSFALPQAGVPDPFVLDAAVVRSAANGLGLMFLQMEPEVIRSLSSALAASGRGKG